MRYPPVPQVFPQLSLCCDSCEGSRLLKVDLGVEVCEDCDGTGIDPEAAAAAVERVR